MSDIDKEDTNKWHRFFAATSNNRAWDLSTKQRNLEEDQEMLNAAHAAAFHWALIGTELNQKRATMLLAEVHSLLDLAASAYTYAEDMKAYFLSNDTPDWELAFTHTIHAHAAYVRGNLDEHASSYANAERAIEEIAEDKERVIVLETFNQIPKPTT